jgi:hypothetical protein
METLETDASRKCCRKRVTSQYMRRFDHSKTLPLHYIYISYPASFEFTSTPKMTVLTEHETQELQRKIERLATALVTPEQCNEWTQHFTCSS